MIIAGPNVAQRGSVSRAYVTVMDLAPTFLELGRARYPADGSVRPMEGESMAALLAGRQTTVHDASYVTTLFHGGRAFVRRGPWKLVTLEPPFDEAAFELFNVEPIPARRRTWRTAPRHPPGAARAVADRARAARHRAAAGDALKTEEWGSGGAGERRSGGRGVSRPPP
jgi:arylsulfatase A-like enzyme